MMVIAEPLKSITDRESTTQHKPRHRDPRDDFNPRLELRPYYTPTQPLSPMPSKDPKSPWYFLQP